MTLSSWPEFEISEINAVNNVLKSGKVNYWTGCEGAKFEKEFADFCGTKYAVALSNGSLALLAAYEALGLGPGTEFITTPRTFIATTSAGVMLGAKPIFADVDINSGNITAETIAPLINSKTKVISVVHLGGWPADMESICALAVQNNLLVLEDCSQAHGAKINGKSVGSFADIAAWSFCQEKIMTTGGEGGMITTDNKQLRDLIWSIKDHGKSLELVKRKDNSQSFKWLHERFGTNYRLTEMQSAIGRVQLKKLSNWSISRSNNSKILYEALSSLKIVRIPTPPINLQHAWYKFYAYLNEDYLDANWSRDRILDEINKEGYPAFQGSCSEIYLEKCFQVNLLNPSFRLPVAKKLGETSLMFLVHPTIKEFEMKTYSNIIKKVLLSSSKKKID